MENSERQESEDTVSASAKRPTRLSNKRMAAFMVVVCGCLVQIFSVARTSSKDLQLLGADTPVASASREPYEQSLKALDLPRSDFSAATFKVETCIRRGTFAFLVQGEGMPAAFWMEISHLNSTHVIWLSWKSEAPRNALPSTMQDVHFLPGSTFTVGRNTLWKKAQEAEARQRWCFEYIVFCDEDVASMTILRDNVRDFERIPNLTPNKSAELSMPVKAIILLQYLLLTHRPARAGVVRRSTRNQLRWGRCHNCCFQDACIEAFHRTAVPHLLPYVERYDSISFWMSAAIMNIFADLIMAPYCMLFSQIMILDNMQKHRRYPKKMKIRKLYRQGMRYLSLFHHSMAIRAIAKGSGKWKSYKRKYCLHLQCIHVPRNVNYVDLLEKTLHEKS